MAFGSKNRFPTLYPRTSDYVTVEGKRDFAGLGMGRFAWVIRWPNAMPRETEGQSVAVDDDKTKRLK